jgi:DNA (cytosine-5)-methyltransferase 1
MNGALLQSLELCAGAGGQALGLEMAKFCHSGVVEIDNYCCETLRLNRPEWNVYEKGLDVFLNEDARAHTKIDLLAGGLPCPPFSIAGKQLGDKDERNLFPIALNLIDLIRPRAVMIENVRGFLGAIFEDYRQGLRKQLGTMGYECDWRLLNASDFGVPQLRPRVVIVAIKKPLFDSFHWPTVTGEMPKTVGQTLQRLMASGGWRQAKAWAEKADEIAPTIVGGSKKHGGPDLGPTRAKRAWASLGVDGMGIADSAPEPSFVGMPRLTVPMVAKLQGFPDKWQFSGRKTAAYRQVGNAFPPPVAAAVGGQIMECLTRRRLFRVAG